MSQDVLVFHKYGRHQPMGTKEFLLTCQNHMFVSTGEREAVGEAVVGNVDSPGKEAGLL